MEEELQHTSAVTPKDFTLSFLERITNKFSKDNIIGYGGYGVVYKGVLDDGEVIAVKKLYHKHPELDDDKQFRNECINLMRVQHENVVRLIGYCYEISHKVLPYDGQYVFARVEERALCFEYLQGGSLHKHLSDETSGFGWHACYNIIKGICEGLHYLHNGSKDPIYHLDLKPANILLDKNMMPKIGDFGLSRLVDSTQTCITKEIRGTYGYMPPEYINRYQITPKFDIFSLGVIIIQIMAGRQGNRYQITPKFDIFSLGVIIIQIMAGRQGYSRCGDMPSQEFIDLVHKNWMKTGQATMSSHTSHEVKTCIKIALRCVEVDRVNRPTISEIVDKLNKIDIAKKSLLNQVTNSRSKQEFNQYASSGAADAESALTAAGNTGFKYGDEGTSIATKEKECGTIDHMVLEEDPAECYNIQDRGRRSSGTIDKLLSAFARLWPSSNAASEGRNGTLWWHDLMQCQAGEVSVAIIQTNRLLEDQCCIESASPLGTVIGVFDGHGGPEAAHFARDHLIPNLREAVSGAQGVTADSIEKAFLAMEEGFITLVSSLWDTRPSLAAVGTCCLVGVVCQGTLFIASLGDCVAVLGKVGRDGQIIAEKLSSEHNVHDESVRKELMAQHPDDPHIVVLRHNVWRVRGIIQVSRTMGDAYLKHQQFNREPLHSKFRVSQPFSRPLLSAIPSIVSRSLQPSDHFIIFASDGLWEQLSNEEAVEIVHEHERAGIARRLIKAAVRVAARKREMSYKEINRIEPGVRRHFHDDITVVVLFIDHGLLMKDHAQGHRDISIRWPAPATPRRIWGTFFHSMEGAPHQINAINPMMTWVPLRGKNIKLPIGPDEYVSNIIGTFDANGVTPLEFFNNKGVSKIYGRRSGTFFSVPLPDNGVVGNPNRNGAVLGFFGRSGGDSLAALGVYVGVAPEQ